MATMQSSSLSRKWWRTKSFSYQHQHCYRLSCEVWVLALAVEFFSKLAHCKFSQSFSISCRDWWYANVTEFLLPFNSIDYFYTLRKWKNLNAKKRECQQQTQLFPSILNFSRRLSEKRFPNGTEITIIMFYHSIFASVLRWHIDKAYAQAYAPLLVGNLIAFHGYCQKHMENCNEKNEKKINCIFYLMCFDCF